MKKLRNDLSFERVRNDFDYDYVVGCLIRKVDNHGRIVNRPCGIKSNSHGYGQVRIDDKMYLVHRVIWLLVYGEWPNGEIDHINGNRMDNRIKNLRVVNKSKNMHNRGMNRNNSSGYPGVSFHKASNKYQAQITVDSKVIHLGFFDSKEEAFLAYQLAKIKYHPTSPIAQEYLRELTYAA